jgi:hypothetical protein
MATATTSAVQTDEFRKIWIKKFEEQATLQGGPPQGNAWEGFDAYRELHAADHLWLVMPHPDLIFSFNFLTDKLAREVQIYKIYETSVVADNQSFRDAIDALSAAEATLKNAMAPKTKVNATKPKVDATKSKVRVEVDKRVTQCASAVEKCRQSLELWRDSYWQDALFAPPEERMRWSVYFDDEKKVHSIPPEELVELEKIFNNAKYPRDLVRQIDLDTRFQVRVAVILRHYLLKDFGITLKTISRLTVLTYICGKLREEGPDHLYLNPKSRRGRITVGGVDQKIRAAGVK